MQENWSENKVFNENLLDEIQFSLQSRTEPNLVVISVPDYGLLVNLQKKVKERLSEYHFFDIDLTPIQVVSLHQTLLAELPKNIIESKRIQYCINVMGLENSRLASENGQIIDSGLIAQLNFEREMIFRKPNYITIVWADRDFILQIQRKAPDLWSWVTLFFEFKPEEAHAIATPLTPPEPTPAQLPARQAYIDSLLDKLNKLPLNNPDQGRAIKERLNIYSLLADEYAKYFDYENAKKYYENAIGISEKLKINDYSLHKLIFDYATLNLDFRHFEEALSLYNKVLEIINQDNKSAIYHQIGMVYQEQRKWTEALENYNEAIRLYKEIGQNNELGGTYHQIGMVYAEQRKWNEALGNYKEAIIFKEETGQIHELGGTYHQIGRIYEEQRKWTEALENYKEAIKLKEQTGQIHELGDTYHQIGRVYEEQRKWSEALENYKEAINFNEQTGQNHQLGSTYHQIGRVYEEQEKWTEALVNYKEAIGLYKETGQMHELGGTFHQIGRIYEEKGDLTLAIEYYQKALSSLEVYQEAEKKGMLESLERVLNENFIQNE